MSSSIAISVPLQNTLGVFCSTNKDSPVSMVKLAFAIVLDQYFDLPEFTCAEALPKDHDDQTHYLITRSWQVQYAPELASTISIRAAFGLRGPDLSSDDSLAPLLVNHTVTATLNGGRIANRPTVSLVFVETVPTLTEALFSSLAAQHNGLGLVVYFDEASLSAHVLYNIDQNSEFVATGFVDAFATAVKCISSISLDTF
ncbi:uncharacterized protein KD926_000082 [Aspergillus affinis]|uniref:uncharacterized protein n=1 Tax=Aspergillus affinis TaxID=1070780 RepID=UPI0022FF133D|nr:uncharacterized protein KD926_000082 [Aspergillus affinis]KAI9037666.1 hypothetical protein KD926_000082 [Aspergillus affinis]